jgi:hypothetical protein
MACAPILRRFFLLFRASAIAAAGPLVAFTRGYLEGGIFGECVRGHFRLRVGVSE